MSMRTHKETRSSKATYGFVNDEGTGIHSSASGSVSIMNSGTATVTQTATATTLAQNTTVASGKTLAVTTADKLTVGGVIVPQQIEISYIGQTTEAATDRAIFIANRAYQVTGVRQVHAVAAGGASKLQLTKDTGTTAPGAGTDLLTNNTNTGFDLNATANTVQVGTLTATTADLQLAAGDRLSLDWANTIQSTAGIVVTVSLVPI